MIHLILVTFFLSYRTKGEVSVSQSLESLLILNFFKASAFFFLLQTLSVVPILYKCHQQKA